MGHKKTLGRDQRLMLSEKWNALKVWDTGKDFKPFLLKDKEIRKYLTDQDLEEIFNVDYHLKHVEDTFERVFT